MSSLSDSDNTVERSPGAPEPEVHESVEQTGSIEKPAVLVEDLHLTYRVNMERKPSLKNLIVRKSRHEQVRYKEVKAIRGISFDVAPGKCTAFIGSNGAGKSTLMRAVAGILPPTKGTISVRGKVSTLLALGVGFNRALTGRENVRIGGLAAGLSNAQVQEQFDEIADFADLGEFIDMPMRTYSSGMYQRLAFAVAMTMEPDILIIDEALSAGDAQFKERAAKRMNAMMDKAGTMLLVSHALGTVRELADEVVWLHKGKLVRRGDPAEVCDAYLNFLKVGKDDVVMEDF